MIEYFERLSKKVVTDSDLTSLEQRLQFKLPDDYKSFLKENNGVKVLNKYMCTFPIRLCSEKSDVLQGLFGIDRDMPNADIYTFMEDYKNDIQRKNVIMMLPIGISAFGSIILLTNKGKIILADFALDMRSSNKLKYTYHLANSFSEFIDGLAFEE